MKRRSIKWLLLICVPLMIGGCAVVKRLNRVPDIAIPADVKRETKRVELQGVDVAVDLYHSGTLENKPLVILLHGFTRNRKVMASLGVKLAKDGFVAVSMDAPFFARHTDNGRAVSELAMLAEAEKLIDSWKPQGRIAYVGHSAGGYATLMASAMNPKPALWVGLDPVDWNDAGQQAAKEIQMPALVLLAESGPWNRHGNAAGFIRSYAGPMLALKLKGSSHLDPEDPSSRGAEWVCGKRQPVHVVAYQELTLLALRAHLLSDGEALAALKSRTGATAIEVIRADERAYKTLATP